MKKSNVIDLSSREENADPLTDLIRQGARKLIEQAIEIELAVYMDALSIGEGAEGAGERRPKRHAPFCIGAAVCAQNPFNIVITLSATAMMIAFYLSASVVE